jgi:thermitase
VKGFSSLTNSILRESRFYLSTTFAYPRSISSRWIENGYSMEGVQMLRALAFCVLVLSLSACGSPVAETNATAAAPTCSIAGAKAAESAAAVQEIPGNRFIIKYKERAGIQSVGSRLARTQRIGARLSKGTKISELDSNLAVMLMPQEISVNDLAAKLPAEEIEYVEPDFKVHGSFISDDPKISNQWAHAVVNSAAAWDVSRGSSSVIVAILDSGIDYNHEDLAANTWSNPGEIPGDGIDNDGNGFVDDIHGWNFVDNNNTPIADDSAFHGTHVAGTVGAVGNNGIGISGHAQNVRLMALKFLGSDGSGYTSDAVKGIKYAIARGAKIINNSWGGGSKSATLSAAIDDARAAGILFVVAAGNEGVNNDKVASYPTNYPQDNIVRVAASDSSDKLASWSNYGPTKVDLAAPGVSIYSTKNGNAYQYLSGTSMATPLVSGVLATMIAARPDLTYLQIKGALLETVDVIASLKGRVAWNGRINAGKALQAVAALDAHWTPPEPPPTVACTN